MDIKKDLSIMRTALTAVLVIVCMLAAVKVSYAEEVVVDNGLPVVYLTIDESAEAIAQAEAENEGDTFGTINDMNKSPRHTVYCTGSVSIEVPDRFHYSDMPDALLEDLPEIGMTIRGRGNTSWDAAKKPYKIKLAAKKDVLGLGENRHWVLIANAYDKTLMKDRITAWLGDEIGMEFTPRGEPVDLVMRNQDGTFNKYLGSYYLSENVRVDTNRVEIDELKKKVKDPDSIEITGGYLLQNSAQEDPASPNVFTTKGGQGWANHSPNFDPADGGYENEAQKTYIRDFIQKFEDTLYAGDPEGKEGPSYRDMMDLESAAKYWLVNTFCVNGDGYGTGSTYIYKKRDTEVDGVRQLGKLYWGPLWDFDYAWYYNDRTDGFELMSDWVKYMMIDKGDDGFVEQVQKEWMPFRKAIKKIYKDGGIIDQYYEEVKASQAQDYITNPYGKMDNDAEGDGYDRYDTDFDESEYVYKDEIEKLKDWIGRRLEWMDQNIYRLDDYVHMASYYVDGKVIGRCPYEDSHFVNDYRDVPDKEGYTFVGWEDENGKLIEGDVIAEKDLNFYARYVPDSETTHAEELYFLMDRAYLDISDESYMGQYLVKYSVFPQDAVDQRVILTSSDESIATVDRDGIVTFKKAGTVTITGRLKYNSDVSKDIVITAKDGPVAEPTSLTIEQPVIRMNKGDHTQLKLNIEPEESSFEFIEFEVNHRGIADVDETGLITAKKGGTVTITVVGNLKSDGDAVRNIKATCKVMIPKEKNPIKVTPKKVTVKRSAVSKKAVKLARKKVVTVKNSKGKLTYALKSVSAKTYKKYFSLNKKTGKLTVKKGLKKGTYKLTVKVTDTGGLSYKKAVKTVKVTVKVK